MSIEHFLEEKRGKRVFLEHEVKAFLKDEGLSVPKGLFIGRNDRVPSSDELLYPIVAKVSSPKIASKSDVHGVRIVKDSGDLEKTVADLLEIGGAEGVLLEEMAPQGLEVIVGGVIDNQFGPVVMFGLGGVFVELFKDVAFGLAPLKRAEALWLIKQIKGYRLLDGYRGRPPVDKDTLIDIIIAVSEFMASGLIEEIDLNPVSLYPEGAMVLDAKMRTLS